MYNLLVDVRMIRLDKGQHKQEEYLSINPLGKVGGLQGLLYGTAAADARLAPHLQWQCVHCLALLSWNNMEGPPFSHHCDISL